MLHIFPVVSLVSYHQAQQHKFFFSLFYLFYYRTIQQPSAWHANSVFKYRAIVLFPIYWHFREGNHNINTICGSSSNLPREKDVVMNQFSPLQASSGCI